MFLTIVDIVVYITWIVDCVSILKCRFFSKLFSSVSFNHKISEC